MFYKFGNKRSVIRYEERSFHLENLLTELHKDVKSIRDHLSGYHRTNKEWTPADSCGSSIANDPDRHLQIKSFQLPDGRNYNLNLSSLDSDTYVDLISKGGGQEWDWKLCMSLLEKDDVFFDLGANIGVFAIPAAVLGAKVHAFELLAPNAQKLGEAIEANDLHNLKLTLGAVWDTGGAVGFVGSSAWGRVRRDTATYVATVRIDEYVEQHGIKSVDLMKIDVEGSERHALLGSAVTVERSHPRIIIESNSLTCGEAGYSYRELLRILTEWGYNLYRIGNGILHPWSVGSVQEVVQTDYLATLDDAPTISRKSGWPVLVLDPDSVIDNVIGQDVYNDYHRMHLLAVESQLPSLVRADSRVSALFNKWQPLQTGDAMTALRVGVGS